MADFVQNLVSGLFFPIIIGLIIWAVTQRKNDQALIAKTLADAGKGEAESVVAKETIEAAVQLADISTLKEAAATMSQVFRDERESLRNQLETAVKTAETALTRQTELAHEVDELRADIERYHREVLDMYRRDQYHAHALQALTDWINTNLPKLLEIRPDLPNPPIAEPLPPLHVVDAEDVPNRRWYDREPSVDTDDQEL